MSVVKKKPAVWPVVVWPLLILLLTGAVMWQTVSGFFEALTDEGGRMVAPGSMELELAEAGDYHVWFYTNGSGDDGKRYEAAGPGAGETVRVEDLGSGRELAVHSKGLSMSKNVFDDRAESAGIFKMRGPGRVRVTVEGGPERVVAVSDFKLAEVSMKMGFGIVIGIGGFMLAVVALVVLLLVRSRRVKLWEAA